MGHFLTHGDQSYNSDFLMLITVPDHALMFVSCKIQFNVICEHISDEKSKRNQRSEKKYFENALFFEFRCFLIKPVTLAQYLMHQSKETEILGHGHSVTHWAQSVKIIPN